MALLLLVLRNYFLHVLRNEMLWRNPRFSAFWVPGVTCTFDLSLCIVLRENQHAEWRRGARLSCNGVLTSDLSFQLFCEASIRVPTFLGMGLLS